ncbi:phospholipid carrier-dependent glycosyltransferase [Cellulomonas fimi]|uniref:dolichyl-phosphate-mannose--protein mannosyltransferase n=1 Tax=Cellulomonas fimi TaxID=1708 RepID=UPI00234C877B|nr:phospholipid carrier-dependent glycosyltransferase [Cellulomonas fimi]MDC7123129.1 phospholipid carrier-dependent glycosyltransferase [Cellulomonas fimi]
MPPTRDDDAALPDHPDAPSGDAPDPHPASVTGAVTVTEPDVVNEESAPTPPRAPADEASAGDGGTADVRAGHPSAHAAPGVPTPKDAQHAPDERTDAPAPTDAPDARDGRLDVPAGTPEVDGEPDSTVDLEKHVEEEPPLPTRERLLRTLLGADRLALDATPRDRLIGWLWPIAVTVLAGIARFWDLGRPHKLVFDETYYVKDAWSLVTRGYEAQWSAEPNPAFESGDMSGLGTVASYVVHPPVGKWVIGLGIQLGGGPDSSAAWRLSVAILGTLSVLMIARIARRLFASTALGVVAGLLLAVDGEAIVMSRISLLDPVLTFFVLAAFGALLIDRERARRRLAERAAVVIDAGGELGWGPRLGWRWWRLAAAVLLGLAIGTKWSGIYFLAVFGLMTVAWDVTARRAVGVRHWARAGVLRDGVVAGVAMVGIGVVTYLASWWSWFASTDAYNRQWAALNPGQGVEWLPPALRSLWKYHQDMWAFHNGLETPHSYAAHPLGWIVQWRPTSFYYPTEVSGLQGQAAVDACGADQCSQAITALGNPVLWWCGAAAILVALVWLIRFRDWRAGAVLSGIAAGWLPWFLYAHRTIFTFYSIAFLPWVVLTLTYVLGLVIGPKEELGARQRRVAIWCVGVLLALVVAVSVFFYPIWSGMVIPYDFWHSHMWMSQWV